MVYENRQNWPEKYDIHKLVSRQEDIDKIINGEKTSVRRNDRYADEGDKVILDGHMFYPQQHKNVTVENARQEGSNYLEDAAFISSNNKFVSK